MEDNFAASSSGPPEDQPSSSSSSLFIPRQFRPAMSYDYANENIEQPSSSTNGQHYFVQSSRDEDYEPSSSYMPPRPSLDSDFEVPSSSTSTSFESYYLACHGHQSDHHVSSGCTGNHSTASFLLAKYRSELANPSTSNRSRPDQVEADTSGQTDLTPKHQCDDESGHSDEGEWPEKSYHELTRKINERLHQTTIANVALASLLLHLLKCVKLPGGGTLKLNGDGEMKKGVLERLNYLLVKHGMPACPGAFGELLYNDLFEEWNNYHFPKTNL